MNSAAVTLSSSRALPAIVTAGAVAGTLDITSAFIIYGWQGATPARILHTVASGLLGAPAYEGGLATAALGLLLHFVIAFGATVVFYLASRQICWLIEHAVTSGLAFGLGVYLFMNLVVLPLSAAKPRYSLSGIAIQIVVHMFLIGLPIALIVRRFAGCPPSADRAATL